MGADTATLTESLDCLRNRWKDFVGEVLHGEYAVWLGSGISRERFPNLGQLLERLLESLHSQIQTSDANCPFRRCLENVIGLTTVRPNNVFVASPKDWVTDDGRPALQEIIDQLWGKYPEALDQTVRVGSQTLTATFHLLKLHEVYGDASKTPDAEHRFVALLIAEGILDELVTTNWDALIEAAHEACGENLDRSLKVIAASEEIDRSRVAGRARLSKIHGCARKTLAEQQASPDQRRYQRHMVTTRFEITAWINLPEFAPFRDLVRQVLRERPALFVGLSGQDLNLQAECFATFMAVPAPTEKQPRVIFSTPALEPTHKGFLKALYGAERYAANEETFTKEAALELRGKPLLGTLYVLALLFKAHQFAERGRVEFGNDELGQPWFDFVEQGRRQWQEFLSHRYDAAADANDPHRAWRQLADELPRVVTRFVTMYRDLTVLASPTAYRALENRHLGMLKSSPNLSELNYHWLMLVLAVLRDGWAKNFWELDLPLGSEARQGQFVLSLSGRVFFVFVVRNAACSLPRMIREQMVNMQQAADVIVIYPADREPARHNSAPDLRTRARRGLSASRFPNRAPRTGPIEIWMRDRVDAHTTPAKLLQALRLEMQSA